MTSNADAFNDASATFQPETRTAPARAYHRKWQGAFDAAEDEENAKTGAVRASMSDRMKRGWKLQSIPGFIFGPLYYFYLRMWRKGLLIIGLLPIIGLTQTIVGGAKFLDILIPVVCMTYAKRDYYRFCVRGETVWPILRFSRNIWTDAALVVGAAIVCSIGIASLDGVSDGKTEIAQRSTSSQAHEADGALPELTDSDLRYIESQGGQSGIDCSVTRQIIPSIFAMRQRGAPIDEAKDYIYIKDSGPRTNAFMYETVEQLYQNPAKMKSMIRTGLWSKACVSYIRGY